MNWTTSRRNLRLSSSHSKKFTTKSNLVSWIRGTTKNTFFPPTNSRALASESPDNVRQRREKYRARATHEIRLSILRTRNTHTVLPMVRRELTFETNNKWSDNAVASAAASRRDWLTSAGNNYNCHFDSSRVVSVSMWFLSRLFFTSIPRCIKLRSSVETQRKQNRSTSFSLTFYCVCSPRKWLVTIWNQHVNRVSIFRTQENENGIFLVFSVAFCSKHNYDWVSCAWGTQCAFRGKLLCVCACDWVIDQFVVINSI